MPDGQPEPTSHDSNEQKFIEMTTKQVGQKNATERKSTSCDDLTKMKNILSSNAIATQKALSIRRQIIPSLLASTVSTNQKRCSQRLTKTKISLPFVLQKTRSLHKVSISQITQPQIYSEKNGAQNWADQKTTVYIEEKLTGTKEVATSATSIQTKLTQV